MQPLGCKHNAAACGLPANVDAAPRRRACGLPIRYRDGTDQVRRLDAEPSIKQSHDCMNNAVQESDFFVCCELVAFPAGE